MNEKYNDLINNTSPKTSIYDDLYLQNTNEITPLTEQDFDIELEKEPKEKNKPTEESTLEG